MLNNILERSKCIRIGLIYRNMPTGIRIPGVIYFPL